MPAEHDAEFQGSFFSMEIDSVSIGMFTGCSGLGLEFDVIEQKTSTKEGKQLLMKTPGRPKYNEVVFKRGFTSDTKLMDWAKEVQDAAKKTPYKTGAIVVLDRLGAEVARFSLLNMWPSKLSVTDLDVSSDSMMVEELTIQHEFIDWV